MTRWPAHERNDCREPRGVCWGNAAEACPFLLDAAQALQSLHPQLAWDALLEAFEAALAAGRFARGAGTAEVLHAVRTAPRPQDEHPSVAGLALDGFAALDEHEDKAGIARLRQAIALAAAQQVLDSEPELLRGARRAFRGR